ncbi:MAG: hypothetical protein Ct9H300mP7_4570 [Verrucomicrobiota bacterium]|nr:MAG: hypothetical protein Ct9H300mP7_4570 [Verrucomicrobiota bacterium]
MPDKDYKKFLTTAGLVEEHQGEIVDTRGQVLGHHDGIEFYTIGQRKGLGLSSSKPMYVVELDPEHNRVVVGEEGLLLRDELRIERCNWIPFDRLTKPIEASGGDPVQPPRCRSDGDPSRKRPRQL